MAHVHLNRTESLGKDRKYCFLRFAINVSVDRFPRIFGLNILRFARLKEGMYERLWDTLRVS